jgi:Tol biopolymer transport system component
VGVEPYSGNSLLASNDDFLGFNAAGVNQAFVVDGSLEVVSQLTNNTSPTVFIEKASLSNDGLVAVTRELDSATGLSDVVLYQRTSSTQDPASVTRTILATGLTDPNFEPVVSSDGRYVAFANNTGGAELVSIDTQVSNSFLSQRNDVAAVGFVANGELAVLRSSGDGSSQIDLFNSTDSAFTNTLVDGLTNASTNSFATVQGGSDALGLWLI